MRLANDRASFTPVHPRIRAIGPRDLHLPKGRGLVCSGLIQPQRSWLSSSELLPQTIHPSVVTAVDWDCGQQRWSDRVHTIDLL
jgi:hypothetical protein